MKLIEQSNEGLKRTIENLILAGTSFDIEHLDHIYHKDLKVIMVDEMGQKSISDKENFKNLFKLKKENNDEPLNTWAMFNHIEVKDHLGHVVVTRKVNLTGEEKKLILSIDLVWENEKWQVTREVIFSQAIK